MAKFEFDRIVTGEEIKGMLEKALGSGFKIAVKKNWIRIVQNATNSCLIQVREKQRRTVCKGPYGYVHFSCLGTVMWLGYLFVVGVCIHWVWVVIILGVCIPVVFIPLLILKALSRKLVRRVAGVLETLARKT